MPELCSNMISSTDFFFWAEMILAMMYHSALWKKTMARLKKLIPTMRISDQTMAGAK
eukprot:CAMPEP_0170482722 /NCGR_PEP_ID=MMETSP0208-20121228/2612_1 /TAXON_ID=197538 /ORGANISM="Strombidium inclinatum, Strain S3" /LENGTH=56 /DNA_ID=CAMNT_0010755585 /DNA_START=661 /DNA_END=831 /DNA_ORIENTATION=+